MMLATFLSENWWAAAVAFVLWSAVVIALTRPRPGEDGDAMVRRVASVLPPSVLAAAAIVFALEGKADYPPALPTRGLHYTGIILLFLFLLAGAALQLDLWIKMRRGAALESLHRTYRLWWMATRLMPAPAALLILASGLRLTYECPGMDVAAVSWLAYLSLAFMFFAVDGAAWYLPQICRWYRLSSAALRQGLSAAQFLAQARDRGAEVGLLVHSLSFPFVVALAMARPQNLPVWEAARLWLGTQFQGVSWEYAQLLRASVLVVIVGALIALVRLRGVFRLNRAVLKEAP